jgi:hypothetical protein
MNADEIVKALRGECEDCSECAVEDKNCRAIYYCPNRDAASLIESLQAQLKDVTATLGQTWEWDMYKCANREIDRLRRELAASQRREKAAVEDLKTVMPYWCCKNKSKEHCPVSSFNGMIDCAYCGDWEWRGPQGSGKGIEQNG